MNKNNNTFFSITFVAVMLFCNISAYAKSLIPAENGKFYYKIGGGQDISMPANTGGFSKNISASNNVGLGYNCGQFSPSLSITNTLNDIKGSIENIDQTIVQQAGAAIGSFAMYELARSDPNMFNIFNNNLLGAHRLFGLSMKSCQTMQSNAAKGENPFTDWMTVSMGNDWKKHMNGASRSRLAAVNSNDLDINQAKDAVEKDNGDNGVPWIGDHNAGGENQAPIHVIADTAIAGFNVLLGRVDNDLSAAPRTNENAHLVDTWADPASAARWIVSVVGDEEITTCTKASCPKGSTPGLGLLPANQKLALTVTQQLQKLISQSQTLTQESLNEVSAPGVAINTQVIRAIQNMSISQQTIVTNKLGQDIATARIIDETLLAKRVLQTGSYVPAIHTNHAAQLNIQRAVNELDQDMKSLLFEVDIRRKVVSNTIVDILQNQQEEAAATRITPSVPFNAPPDVQDGAVMNDDQAK